MKINQTLLGLMLSSAIPSAMAVDVTTDSGTHFVSTDRYTKQAIEARGDQVSPLESIISAAFGDEVKTVGQAVKELLEGSGYSWAAPTGNDDAMLNDLPLPVVNRDIGPIRLRDALTTVTGKAWRLHIDELHRSVWFEVNRPEPIQAAPAPKVETHKRSNRVK